MKAEEFDLDLVSQKLESIRIRHELMLMEYPELIEMNKEFLKRKQEYKDSFTTPATATKIELPTQTRVLSKVVPKVSTSMHAASHQKERKSSNGSPNKIYNVKLTNHPVFIRRTSIKPDYFDKLPRTSITIPEIVKPSIKTKIMMQPKKRQADAVLQTINEDNSDLNAENSPVAAPVPQTQKIKESLHSIEPGKVKETQTSENKIKTEVVQTSPRWSNHSKSSSSTTSNQTFKNLAKRHVVDWMVQQAFIKALGDSSEQSITLSSISSSSDALFDSYAENILNSALKEYIYEQYILINRQIPNFSPSTEPSFTLASTDISLFKKSSSSSSKSKKVSFVSDDPIQQSSSNLKTPLSDISIDPLPVNNNDQFESPSMSKENSMTELSMTETKGEVIPIGSEGEYLDLPSFDQMLTNFKIPQQNDMESMPTFSTADLNITSSEAVSVGQILMSSYSGEPQSNSEGEIGINYKAQSPKLSSFGSVLSDNKSDDKSMDNPLTNKK